MAGWHHWLNGCESEWTPGGGDGQGGLACCDSWGRKESDMTEWTELNWIAIKDKYWNNKLNLKPDMQVSNHKSFKNDEVYSITLFPLKI